MQMILLSFCKILQNSLFFLQQKRLRVLQGVSFCCLESGCLKHLILIPRMHIFTFVELENSLDLRDSIYRLVPVSFPILSVASALARAFILFRTNLDKVLLPALARLKHLWHYVNLLIFSPPKSEIGTCLLLIKDLLGGHR